MRCVLSLIYILFLNLLNFRIVLVDFYDIMVYRSNGRFDLVIIVINWLKFKVFYVGNLVVNLLLLIWDCFFFFVCLVDELDYVFLICSGYGLWFVNYVLVLLYS